MPVVARASSLSEPHQQAAVVAALVQERRPAEVSVKGTADDVLYQNLPPSSIVELTDPRTGTTYRAAQTDDGRSVTFNLLKTAKDYMDGSFAAARSAYQARPTDPVAINNWQVAQQNLSSQLETLDDIRWFFDKYASGQNE